MTMPTDILAYNRQVIETFRANGRRSDGGPMLLLTTTGARTGQPRTSPMMFAMLSGRMVVIGSNMGAPRHPDWYHNLVASPDVTVEVEGEAWPAIATTVTGDDRSGLWDELLQGYPFFADHQAKTTREIPLVELVRQPLVDEAGME